MHKIPTFDNAKMQRHRLLRFFLEESPRLTVGQAREKLGIMSPPARILELRRQNHRIKTVWINEIDNLGITHRNGTYIYQGQGGNNEHSNQQ